MNYTQKERLTEVLRASCRIPAALMNPGEVEISGGVIGGGTRGEQRQDSGRRSSNKPLLMGRAITLKSATKKITIENCGNERRDFAIT